MKTVVSPTIPSAESPVTRAEFDTLRYETEHKVNALRRRVQVLASALVAVLAVTILLPIASPALAQGYGVTLAQLLTRVIALETKTASMSAITDPNTNQPTVRFSGVNLQVVSGLGQTGGTNGTGNIIVGYNELRGDNDDRSGSHNLVIGYRNNYSANAYGGMVVGAFNNITNTYSSISGGYRNTASGDGSSISGGNDNVSSGSASSVSGGNTRTQSNNSGWTGGTYFSP